MPRAFRAIVLILVAILSMLAWGVSARAGQELASEPTRVHIYASDFAFVLDRTIIPEGPVEFELVNISPTHRHEVWIYPLDYRDDPRFQEMLALKRTGQRASETDYIPGIVARSGELAAGEVTTFTANLPPGVYEVACLAREGEGDERMVHYDEGMYAVLAVRAPIGR